ncbi:MAG: hypothetical protein WBN48_19755 [Thiogranum sp.]
MNETLSRSVLALEALVLLLPLSALYGALFTILFPNGGLNEFSTDPSLLIAALFAGAGLLALWRLLATAVISGIAALRAVHRGWMLFCALIAAWVAVAWLIVLLTPVLADVPASFSGIRGAVLGLYGAPALLPLLHLAAELRWRKGGLT